MLTLYNFAIFLFRVGIALAANFSKKANLRYKGRNHWKNVPFNTNEEYNLAWFHCASLGEFEQGKPVIESFKKNYPSFKILLTFFSPSGFELKKNDSIADFVTYLPLDTPSNAREFLKKYNPKIAFFVKYEFWPNFIFACKAKGIPMLFFSTIFRENQVFFKLWGGFFRKALYNINHIFVQNENSQKLLENINYTKTSIAGDTRFDRVYTHSTTVKNIDFIDHFKNNSSVFVCGSVWQEDMDVLIPFINLIDTPNLKFIIAPHEIRQDQIKEWLKSITKPTQLFSSYDPSEKCEVLMVDNIGMLSSIYAQGNYAFIGGAFGKGLHNILEPAVFGIPVFFGNKNYRKFDEANKLIALHSAFAISNSEELKKVFKKTNQNKSLKEIKNNNTHFIQKQLGASEKVIKYCNEHLNLSKK